MECLIAAGCKSRWAPAREKKTEHAADCDEETYC